MKKLMTRAFSKWVSKREMPENDLTNAIEELQADMFEANLGGYVFKKRIRFKGHGKSGSGRPIICYKKEDRAIFIHGFAKNEKSDLSPKELNGFKALSKILMQLSPEEIALAIRNGDFIEVT